MAGSRRERNREKNREETKARYAEKEVFAVIVARITGGWKEHVTAV